jgi:hypothetical protein
MAKGSNIGKCVLQMKLRSLRSHYIFCVQNAISEVIVPFLSGYFNLDHNQGLKQGGYKLQSSSYKKEIGAEDCWLLLSFMN